LFYSFQYQKQKHRMFPMLPFAVGDHHIQEKVNRPRGLPQYQCFYCVKGEGELILDGQRMLVRPGQAMVLQANDAHIYHQTGPEKWVLDIVMLNGPSCGEIMKVLGIHQSGVYGMDDPKLFQIYIKRLLKAGEKEARECAKVCYDFLLDFAASIHRIHAPQPAKENPLIEELVDYMTEHFAEDISLEDMASFVGLSKEYMCTIFKKEMGETMIHYLTIIRIGHAKMYLKEYPDKHAAEVGRMCGYESPSYFGKVFKAVVGMSPEQYRK